MTINAAAESALLAQVYTNPENRELWGLLGDLAEDAGDVGATECYRWFADIPPTWEPGFDRKWGATNFDTFGLPDEVARRLPKPLTHLQSGEPWTSGRITEEIWGSCEAGVRAFMQAFQEVYGGSHRHEEEA